MLLTFENIGMQGVQELFFGELKDFGDSRIKSMTCKMFLIIKQTTVN